MTVLYCIASFMFGGLAGVMVMALCAIAKEADREIERQTSTKHPFKEDL